MLAAVDLKGRPFHFIGIGGIGMSALAHILAKRKLPVSGSDLRSSHITQQLQDLGAQIFWQQEAANLEVLCRANGKGQHLPQVICSTAIHPNNLEYQAAVGLGCPIFHRSDLLGSLMMEYQSIAIAGTHGKTTTSSLIGYLLLQAGLDPTIVVGGEVKAWAGNARAGEGPYLVAEADESDGSLVKFSPQIGVITNIELDHPDHYSSLEEVVEIFHTFAHNCQTLVACLDCPTIQTRLFATPDLQHKPLVSYGLQPERGPDYTADQVVYGPTGTSARIWERGHLLGHLDLPLLGQHNLSNALAAIAVGRLLKLDFDTIAAALATFEGARRRFELRGEVQGMCFIDDYAHHPSEIQATLTAARLRVADATTETTPWRRVVAVFQPHRYSRSLKFLPEFATSFAEADVVVVTDIYSAGEPDQGLIQKGEMAAAIAAHHPNVQDQRTLEQVQTWLKHHLKPGDFVVFLGAGNLNQIIPELLTYFKTTEIQSVPEVAVR